MDISRHTVKSHLAAIREKMGVNKTCQIVYVLSNENGDIANITATKREVEIFLLIIEGKTSREIANQFEISINTVRRHRENMLRTNQCKNILELMNKYYGKGK